MKESPTSSTPTKRITLRNARGEELVLEEDLDDDETAPETVVASDRQGNTLTLLEELSLRERKNKPSEFIFAFICAVASLAFAALIYFKSS